MPLIEVLSFDLDLPEPEVSALRSLLSPEEIARADRFIVPEHAHRFTVAHARLRQFLGDRLHRHPADIRYHIAPQGKPSVTGCGLHFNLSHSGQYGLIAMGEEELGVDIELVRSDRNTLGIAQRFFTAAETAWLAALDPDARPRGFCRLWTCKEAWLKADGRGLALPLNQVEVTLGRDAAALRSLGPDARRWSVRELDLASGYAAAVVLAQPLAPDRALPRIELSFPPLPAASRSTAPPA